MPTRKTSSDSAKKATATRAASGPKSTAKGTASRSKAKKPATGPGSTAYTKPELREKIKEKVKAGDKGGKPGQWSARKAQLVATEYKKEGGDYKEGAASGGQEHLKAWTDEKWQTADGKKAARGKTTARYLPKKAWENLSPEERKATDEKKKRTSRTGKQFVANTPAAKKARQKATKTSN